MNVFRALWGKSLFRRMYLFYALIIILLMALLGIYMARSFSNMIINQALEYNRQQLSSLETAFAQQLSTLEYLMGKIYEVQTNEENNIYDSIQMILKDDKPFTSATEYNEFIQHADTIITFFRLVQSSLQTEISLFQIKGAEQGQGNINILWPTDNLGMLEYAREINEFIEKIENNFRPGTGVHSGRSRLFPFISDSGPVSKRNFYVMYDYIIDKENQNKVVGYLINGYNVSDLNRVLHSFSYPLVGTAYILDGSGLVLYASDLSDAGIIPGFFSGISGTPWDTNRINGNIYNVIYNRDYDFYTVGKIPEAELFKNVRARNLSILAISIVSAAIAILLTLLSTWSLKRRVKSITKTMTVAETGDLSVRAKVSTYDDELDRISSGLNSMIININEHINTEYLSELRRKNAELRQREAELSALQSEVNPHFLYNTLESIRMQAVLNKDQDTAVLIRLLANLFRNRIKNGTVVKINDELVYCKSLIEILSARYGGDIDISLDIPKEIEEYGILRDLLQPILENAFIHGFSEEYEREKRLSISGVIEQGVINLRVQNSGKSIEKEKLRRIRDYIEYHDSATEDGNIGLLNVHQRIHLVYGEGYGVYINSDEERGTTVGIKIQALTVEQLKEMIS